MLRNLLELLGSDGRFRLATLATGPGTPGDPPALFVGLSVGPVAQVQRLTRDQVLDVVDVLEEWLFDTSPEGRPTVQLPDRRPAV